MQRQEFVKDKLKIIFNDCLAELKSMDDKSVDLVVTSPPYNINKEYNTYKDNKTEDDYLNWLYDISLEVKRVLKDDGSYFLNIGSTNKNHILLHKLICKLSSILNLQNDIVWVKSITVKDKSYGEDEESFGHFKPINSKRYLNHLHENIFHLTKNGDVELDRLSIGVEYKDKSNIERWASAKNKRCRGNVWFIPYKTAHSKADKLNHPASFPEQLVDNCIKLHGIKDNMTVLDIFLGCGTTLSVCKNLNFNGIGIENDEQYVNSSKIRLGF